MLFCSLRVGQQKETLSNICVVHFWPCYCAKYLRDNLLFVQIFKRDMCFIFCTGGLGLTTSNKLLFSKTDLRLGYGLNKKNQ